MPDFGMTPGLRPTNGNPAPASLLTVVPVVVNYVIVDVTADVTTVAYGARVVTGGQGRRSGVVSLTAAAGGGVGVMQRRLLLETVREAALEFGEDEQQNEPPRLARQRVELPAEVFSEHLHRTQPGSQSINQSINQSVWRLLKTKLPEARPTNTHAEKATS